MAVKKRARVMIVAGRFAKFFGVKPVDKIAHSSCHKSHHLSLRHKEKRRLKISTRAARQTIAIRKAGGR